MRMDQCLLLSNFFFWTLPLVIKVCISDAFFVSLSCLSCLFQSKVSIICSFVCSFWILVSKRHKTINHQSLGYILMFDILKVKIISFTKKLSSQKLLQIIPVDNPTTQNGCQDNPVLHRSSWGAVGGWVQSWPGEWPLSKKLSWQKLFQIIPVDDPAAKDGCLDSPVLRRSS